VRGGVIVGSAARRPSETEIVERYRRLRGDEAARVMRQRLTDPSPDSQREWACVCAPMYRLRPPDETLSRILREQDYKPELNEHFMTTFGDLDLRGDLATVRDPMLVLAGPATPSPRQTRPRRSRGTPAATSPSNSSRASHQVP